MSGWEVTVTEVTGKTVGSYYGEPTAMGGQWRADGWAMTVVVDHCPVDELPRVGDRFVVIIEAKPEVEPEVVEEVQR